MNTEVGISIDDILGFQKIFNAQMTNLYNFAIDSVVPKQLALAEFHYAYETGNFSSNKDIKTDFHTNRGSKIAFLHQNSFSDDQSYEICQCVQNNQLSLNNNLNGRTYSVGLLEKIEPDECLALNERRGVLYITPNNEFRTAYLMSRFVHPSIFNESAECLTIVDALRHHSENKVRTIWKKTDYVDFVAFRVTQQIPQIMITKSGVVRKIPEKIIEKPDLITGHPDGFREEKFEHETPSPNAFIEYLMQRSFECS